jgi:xanthosine phosphorylase
MISIFNQLEYYMYSAIELIKSRAPRYQPKVGLILGSGLGALGDAIESPCIFNYEELTGFPVSTVAGHAGRLILGSLGNIEVACLQGRTHLYEGITAHQLNLPIRLLKQLGCEILLITNAAGSLRLEVGPGQLMLVTDHINLQGTNPLLGPNDTDIGPRFVAMEDAYDPDLRERMCRVAKQQSIVLAQGVYLGTLGPMFETPAEIRAFRTLGADAVGMSTIAEVISARHCGLRVSVISAITNFAAGMSSEKISHAGTLHYAQIAANDLCRLITHFLKSLSPHADN